MTRRVGPVCDGRHLRPHASPIFEASFDCECATVTVNSLPRDAEERRGPITGAPGIGPCTKGSGSRALLVSHTLNLQPLKPRIGMSLRMDIARLHAVAEFAGFRVEDGVSPRATLIASIQPSP